MVIPCFENSVDPGQLHLISTHTVFNFDWEQVKIINIGETYSWAWQFDSSFIFEYMDEWSLFMSHVARKPFYFFWGGGVETR